MEGYGQSLIFVERESSIDETRIKHQTMFYQTVSVYLTNVDL